MKLMHHLDQYTIKQLNKIRGPSSKEPVAKPAAGSSLSRRELYDLMGTNLQTYHRVGGRVRGK